MWLNCTNDLKDKVSQLSWIVSATIQGIRIPSALTTGATSH